MSYRTYIKEDYKPELDMAGVRRQYVRNHILLLGLGVLITALAFRLILSLAPPVIEQQRNASEHLNPPYTTEIKLPALTHTNATNIPDSAGETRQTIPWQSIEVQPGDNLSLIFKQLGLSATTMHQIVSLDNCGKILNHLKPGQKLQFHITGGKLIAMRLEPDLTTTVLVTNHNNEFKSELIITELEKRNNEVEAVIDHSLFIAGQNAGLSDNLIMHLVEIYGWDIDFVLDIRNGDKFKLIYEEQFKAGVKVGEGPILAAVFYNNGKTLHAVRYEAADGRTDYYSDSGASMRKAFLRTPLKFSRISSSFNQRRKHPILNKIRAHNGVDYAAPMGTPVKSTGDGTVIYAGKKGGYGNTVILRHGGSYSTLYAHMSRFAKSISSGTRVKQGQIIGYVGMTGLATGPHLHYEFRVNGIHRNPLTVELPKADSIAAKDMDAFRSLTNYLLAQLDRPTSTEIPDPQKVDTNYVALAHDQNK